MMPRHNLAPTHSFIESFYKEWGVTYHEADMVDGNIKVLNHAANVSDDFLIEMINEFLAM